MKYLIAALFAIGLFASCSKELDTKPTDKIPGNEIFDNEISAKTTIDGAYAALWRAWYVTSNQQHAVGYQSTLLAQDLMADDMVQIGFNWFGPDYALDYTATIDINDASRSYNVWNMMYTVIGNTNYIIANEAPKIATSSTAKDIVAQAYALRAFCYFELIQSFQKTFIGHELDPGVPVYTEPTRAGDQGKARGTVADVYVRINEDLDRSIELFEELGKRVQTHCSHIDYYVAQGILARVCLVQGRSVEAIRAADEALSRLTVKILPPEELTKGFSDKTLPTNLWTMEMTTEQSAVYGSIYCFFDPKAPASLGYNYRKCISTWLYNRIIRSGMSDARKAWFKDGAQGKATTGENVNYGQMKRMAKVLANWVGDLIYMRGEEMLLIKAEAYARQGLYDEARALLKELGNQRQTTDAARANYAAFVDGLADDNVLPTDTGVENAQLNVLEEVIIQRRIELWGEIGRIKDILRLKQGFSRSASTNHTQQLITVNTGPESGAFLFKIPQKEFDGNKFITPAEQNPVN